MQFLWLKIKESADLKRRKRPQTSRGNCRKKERTLWMRVLFYIHEGAPVLFVCFFPADSFSCASNRCSDFFVLPFYQECRKTSSTVASHGDSLSPAAKSRPPFVRVPVSRNPVGISVTMTSFLIFERHKEKYLTAKC